MVVIIIMALCENLNITFHFQNPLNYTFINIKIENMLKANDV